MKPFIYLFQHFYIFNNSQHSQPLAQQIPTFKVQNPIHLYLKNAKSNPKHTIFNYHSFNSSSLNYIPATTTTNHNTNTLKPNNPKKNESTNYEPLNIYLRQQQWSKSWS